jgi:UDP-N-acetylmuramate--alanine ligase
VKAVQGVSGGEVAYAGSVADAVKVLVSRARAGDVILTLGAGSVSQAGPILLDALAAKA